MAYTLFPDDDKAQVDGSAITATSTLVNGMTVFALGTSVPADGPVTAQVQLGIDRTVFGSQLLQSKYVFGAYQSASPVSLTSVADNGSGFCRFTKAGHVLAVGDVINVINSTSGNVNGVQKVTAVAATTFDTDKAYTAAAAAGQYRTVAGDFATLTVGNYIMKGGVPGAVAGGQYTVTGFGSDYGFRRSIHKVEHVRTRRVATAIRAGYWNIYSGEFSTQPEVADDISSIGADHAATPSYAVPGELVYRVSGQPDGTHGITQDDYPPKTS